MLQWIYEHCMRRYPPKSVTTEGTGAKKEAKIDHWLASAIEAFSSEVQKSLGDNRCTIYLYGSVALGDFQPLRSDIDVLCLTERPFHDEAANQLVKLRQALLKNEPNHPYYRFFYLKYHLSICERPDMVGATNHTLDVLRKYKTDSSK